MLETLIFQCSIAIAHKFDNFNNISKRLWNLVYIWSLFLSLKFQANTYSFERVVTLLLGTTFHPDTVYISTNAALFWNIYQAIQMIHAVQRLLQYYSSRGPWIYRFLQYNVAYLSLYILVSVFV